MKIESARVRNYRCIIDSGPFEVERDKTISSASTKPGRPHFCAASRRPAPFEVAAGDAAVLVPLA
jgi:hypothetical protein